MSIDAFRLEGLVAATHTPMQENGKIAIDLVPIQARILRDRGVIGAFVCGSTGEGVAQRLGGFLCHADGQG